uniref:Solute-binding protein family 3/N-terminal domain-containing protein n=1 Tax=Pseudictyota dubia TaxID=2749911 RepID=A0A7R9VIJ6_9STRA|mmetsp:Transcript_14445/g.27529  ORF Transcript_14445/g.27529 Transcript_14445/m.27529 type:complete len:626 (+) Transcript_14445:35-1912(+)
MSEHSRPNDERNDGGGEPSIVEGAAEAECTPTSSSGIVRDQQLASDENDAGVQTVRQFFSDGRGQTVACRSTNSVSVCVDDSGTGERGDSAESVGRDNVGVLGLDTAGTTPEVWRHTQSADSIFYAPLEGRSSGAIDGASGLGPRESSAPSLSLVQPSLQCHMSAGSASGPPPRDDEAAIVFEDPRTGSKGNKESKEAPKNLASACSVPAAQSSSEATFSTGRESGGGDVAEVGSKASSGPETPSADECQYRSPFATGGGEEDEYDDDESKAGSPPRDDEAATVFHDPRTGGKETTFPLERLRLRKWRFREKNKSMPDVSRKTPARVEMASAPSATRLGRAAFARNSEFHDAAVANSGTPLGTANIGPSSQHSGESNEERPRAHAVTSQGSDDSFSSTARRSVSAMSGGSSSDTSLVQTEMAGLPIAAVAVNLDEEIDMLEQRRSQMRDALRSEILAGAARAEVIGKGGSGCSPKSMNNCRIGKRIVLATGLIFLISIVIGVSLGFSGRGGDAAGNDSNAGVPSSTFASVLESDVLRCGMRSADIAAGFITINEDGEPVGFYVDLCRSVAAAMFGSPDLIELIPLSEADRFAVLATGGVDVLIRGDTHTFERDVHEVSVSSILAM